VTRQSPLANRLLPIAVLSSLFLTAALPAQPLPFLNPDTTAPATPETLNVQQRVDQLVGLLHKQIGRFELWRTVQGGLPNDHVGNN
jgi:hypothetical protein